MQGQVAGDDEGGGSFTPRESPAAARECLVRGPIIVGAGPSGLAVAATLSQHAVPFTVLERSDSIADLWTNRTYDRLRLHLPKVFCELPHARFPPALYQAPWRGGGGGRDAVVAGAGDGTAAVVALVRAMSGRAAEHAAGALVAVVWAGQRRCGWRRSEPES